MSLECDCLLRYALHTSVREIAPIYVQPFWRYAVTFYTFCGHEHSRFGRILMVQLFFILTVFVNLTKRCFGGQPNIARKLLFPRELDDQTSVRLFIGKLSNLIWKANKISMSSALEGDLILILRRQYIRNQHDGSVSTYNFGATRPDCRRSERYYNRTTVDKSHGL